ncbi:MAG: V-type H(+)-translocating pyrophosphatase [Candidatus Peribacteria bacterium]|nr:V-type H(+)-translocating pyrophosphatase [Candidatus Peribacteria bacterium]
MDTTTLEFLIPVLSIVGLLYSLVFWAEVKRAPNGTPEMQKVAAAISTGARAFMKRQYRTITILSLIVGIGIILAYGLPGLIHSRCRLDMGDFEGQFKCIPLNPMDSWIKGLEVGLAFLLGAFLSGLSGVVSMVVATKANLKTAAVAKNGMDAALKMSLRAGTVSALVITSLSILGVSGMYLFYVYGLGVPPEQIPELIVGYGFGASFVALFAQLGGGIYTKAADVGADLVGKIEAGIPEDDPRNPAVIADLVGDNVGDCAGRGADLFESISAENIGAMILGAVLFPTFGINGVLFPLALATAGLFATIIGVYFVKAKPGKTPMRSMQNGYWVTTLLMVIVLYFATKYLLVPNVSFPAGYMNVKPIDSYWFFRAGLVGIATSVAFVYLTDYYTGKQFRPVKSIADASTTGHGTNVIAGVAVGMESTGLTVLTICVALYLSNWLGTQTGLENGGLFGTAVATMGMLSTVGYILAMDMFGPITDNAGGIVEMSGAPEELRTVTDELDATGNTTKALTKGYAVGSAALAAFLLFSAYLKEVHLTVVNLASIPVFVGAFFGAMVVFFFTSLTIRAVGKAAGVIVEEVRRQFREKTGIMDGTDQPDYAAAVDIATKSALHEMILPGIVAVAAPILVGTILGAEAVAGLLMVGTIAGVLLAAFLNNSGGAWDNAKKLIETGYHGGKKSPAHQAAVTGDTVGDPFKDTAGPSLHVLIKLFSTLTLALAALFM